MNVAATLPSRLARWRDPALWSKASDIVAVLIALTLPWSTSLVGIFAMGFVLTVAPTIESRAFAASLRRPVSSLPIVLFVLALAGMLWSEAPWGERSYALGQLVKFLVLPLLIYHFERSAHGMWVFAAFLISCLLMVLMSWLVLIYPGLAVNQSNAERGIFVKNYIDQSQEFSLCAVALVHPVYALLRTNRIWLPLVLTTFIAGFIVNMAFVIVSRTALVTMPIMFAAFAVIHLKWRTNLVLLVCAIALAVLAWLASPQLQATIEKFPQEYQNYKEFNQTTSIGARLEFYRKSVRFFSEAPLIGHGTGSTRRLFEAAATGPAVLAAAQVIGNPHNQTLNVAVQWGSAGILALYAMWLSHLLLFRGACLVSWIGLLVVLQNIFSSLFNSHLFDFHEGWMYVLGVGVAGGMLQRSMLKVKDEE